MASMFLRGTRSMYNVGVLQHNWITSPEVIEILESMPDLRVLYLQVGATLTCIETVSVFSS